MMEEDINRDTRQPHKGSNVCGCLANTRDHQLFTDDYSISLCYSNLRHKSYSEDQHQTTPCFLIAPNLEQIPTFLSPFQTLPQAHPKTLELIAHPHLLLIGTNCQLSILRKVAARSSLSYIPGSNNDNKSLNHMN